MAASRRLTALAGAGLLALAGCAQRYDRVAVVGLVVPVRAPPPAPGTTLQELPPLEGLPVTPDTSDGAVLVEVDQQRFWQDHGYVLPAWQAPRPGVPDAHLDDLRGLAASIAAIRVLLDGVFAAAGPQGGADQAGAAAAAAPDHAGASTDAGRRRASLVLSPADWSGLTDRLATLAARIDALAGAARQEDGLGGSGGAHDGKAIHQRLAEAQWAGLEPLALDLAAQAGDLGVDGAFAALRRHPAHGAAMEEQLDQVRTVAQLLARTVRQREPGQVVTAVRLVARALDGLAASPLSALAFGAAQPDEPPITRAARDQSRARLAGLRQTLAMLTARWAADNAALLQQQPLPTLVWQPAAKVD